LEDLDAEAKAQMEEFLKAHFYTDPATGDAFTVTQDVRDLRMIQVHKMDAALVKEEPDAVQRLNGAQWRGSIRLQYLCDREFWTIHTDQAWSEWRPSQRAAEIRLLKKRDRWRRPSLDGPVLSRAATPEEVAKYIARPMRDSDN
jgi:hypothetical protein